MRFRHTRVTAAAVTVIALGVAGLTAGPAQSSRRDHPRHSPCCKRHHVGRCVRCLCVRHERDLAGVLRPFGEWRDNVFHQRSPGTYKIRFEDNATQRNYLDEYYDNAGQVEDSQPVPVTSGGDVLLNLTELAPAGTASGTMTGPAAAALDPSSNVCVYAFDTATVEQYAHVAGTCVDPLTGTYTLAAPPGPTSSDLKTVVEAGSPTTHHSGMTGN